MKRTIRRGLLLITVSASTASAFGAGAKIQHVDAVSNQDAVDIQIDLTAPVKPIISAVGHPRRLIVDFPNVLFEEKLEQITVGKNGVDVVRVCMNQGTPSTRITIGIDSVRPYGIEQKGNSIVLSILPSHGMADVASSGADRNDAERTKEEPRLEPTSKVMDAAATNMLVTESLPLEPRIERPEITTPAVIRRRFRVKYIAGNTAYIDGGSNSGFSAGMTLAIKEPASAGARADGGNREEATIAFVRIIGVAAASAITEIRSAGHEIKAGDLADLTPADADAAIANARNAIGSTPRNLPLPSAEQSDSSGAAEGMKTNTLRTAQSAETDTRPRMAGRIGFDYSGIASTGSTPGTSTQVGMSFQSDMTHLLGTRWNLEGYWRGRITHHSQFLEPTIEESLNKTYTMQLYYDNLNSKWVAGVGRLYLPWAVSLDTIDGGYFGRKSAFGMTTGIFAGSTPDLNSWHYRPNQRIGGSFVNFEGGDYEKFHYSSTAGAALSSIGWKLDKPFIFFENEASYKGNVSVYHSLIADSPQGVSTKGYQPGPGVSHSYFTAHYQPKRIISFDVYHNYFRDAPTATTTIVGTGLVDKLLFQGVSAGIHLRPTRFITLYGTLGASEKTGDTHRSLNEMYGATWSEIARTGIRADFHYSKFNSNFGNGNYQMLSLSRQLTNRMFWNVQVGRQDLISQQTANYDSIFVADSMDFNMGRHSYLQSGYTYVNGATLNYRQWYLSWGYRFDAGKNNPEYVQTVGSGH